MNTILLRPVETYRCLPSLAMAVPIGRMPSPSLIVLTVASRFVSITDNVPPFSDGTYARDPSGRNAIDRGRGPTFTDLTTLPAATSTTNTAPSSSDVTHT